MFDLPDPAGMFNEAVLGKLERDQIRTFISAWWSNYITGLWRQGCVLSTKWFGSEGEVLKDMAVSTYLTVEPLMKAGFALTVPQDMLQDANRLARFQTEMKTK